MPVTVVVADDSLLVREGVLRVVEHEADLTVVGQCGVYDTLLALVDQQRPDVVVTDIRMPPTGTDEGVRAAAALRTSHPHIGVVVLSQFSEPEPRHGSSASRWTGRGWPSSDLGLFWVSGRCSRMDGAHPR